MPAEPRPVILSRPALLRLLDALDGSPDATATTVYLRHGSATPPLDAEALAALDTLGERATGAVVFWGEGARVVVAPPFPVEGAVSRAGYVTAPLRELLARPRTLGVVLVRLGGYSVGLYRDGTFAETKTGGRFVKNRHRKGGQSQRRFERIREGQIREHFDDVADVIRAKLLPHAAELDAVILGGDRHTTQQMLKRAPLPPPLAGKLLPRVIDTPEPRREVLEQTPRMIWSSRVVVVAAPTPGPSPARAGRGRG